MEWTELYKRVSPALKRIAGSRNYCARYIDRDDLYQEMCMYLWEHYKDGIPKGINDSYIIKGCEFHILNYIRVRKERARMVNLEDPLDEEGTTLKDTLACAEETLDHHVDKKIVVDEIINNGFTKREKEVFSLLLNGYTVREAGDKLGISHVRVVRLKKNLIKKWQRKKK